MNFEVALECGQRGRVSERVREWIPDSWSLIGKRTLTKSFSADSGDSIETGVRRGPQGSRWNVQIQKLGEILRTRTLNCFKAETGNFV